MTAESMEHIDVEFDVAPSHTQMIESLLPDALHRPAAEGVRIVALWWLEQTRQAHESQQDAGAPLRNLISTLRENRELLSDAPIKRELRQLRDLQRALDSVSENLAQREWLESELDMLLPDARAEAVHLGDKLSADAEKQTRVAMAGMRKQFDKVEQALQSALSRFSIRGTVGVALNLDPFSAHAAGRLNRHTAKLVRALNDVEGISSKRELSRAGDSLGRVRALLFPFISHLPALGALYHSATQGEQQLAAMRTAARLAKHARHEKLDGLAAVLDDVRLSHYNAFATAWLEDKGDRGLKSSYAALAALQLSVDVTQLSNGRFTSEFGIPMEIERKYLLTGCPPEAAVVAGTRIEQGWLPGRTLRERLRRSTYPTGVSRYTRTVKFGRGISRVELEEDTDRLLFEALWPLTVNARVRKRRHAIREGAYTWEIDVFTDRDLVIAEVELSSADESPALPAWLERFVVREVTGEAEYVNANLALADDEHAQGSNGFAHA
ncbi:MAG: hypothetical protein ABI852_01115 [Gemmatimonadaceae bacterium]